MRRLRAFLDGHFGGLPPVFWWLWIGAFVSSLATFVFPFLALFLQERGLTVSQIGQVVSLFGAGGLAASLVGGWLADRFGRRPTLLISLALAGAVTAGLGFLRAPLAISAAVFLFGLTTQASRPAIMATIADVVPEAAQERAFGLGYWANNIGMTVSLILGGLLASLGWATLFVADAATTLLFAACAFWKVPETHPARVAGGVPHAEGRGYAAALRDGPLLALLALNLAFIVPFFQFQVTAPIDMGAHGLGPAGYGRVMAVNGVLIAFLQPFAPHLTRGLDKGTVLAIGAALVGLGYGGYALCGPEWQWALATGVWSLGEILSLPTGFALVAELSPEDLRGRYQGLSGLVFGAGMIASPVIGSAWMERAGPRALWVGCAVLGAAVAGGHLLAAGPRRRALAQRLPAPGPGAAA